MMQSPFLGDMSTEVTTWSSSLQQVEEITDLWYTCQKKVITRRIYSVVTHIKPHYIAMHVSLKNDLYAIIRDYLTAFWLSPEVSSQNPFISQRADKWRRYLLRGITKRL